VIIYELVCGHEHRFEGWFRNSAEFESQSASRAISCPTCGSDEIRRVPSAGRVTRYHAGAGANGGKAPVSTDTLRKLHDYVERNFEYVGSDFADEARRIHRGESEERNIRGEASAAEISNLVQEGITALPLPAKPPAKDRLN
jgi:hypothetical protein